MVLPTQEEIDKILIDRPGDQLFENIKPKLTEINAAEGKLRQKLVSLILQDLVYDLAVSNALDDIGPVLEYLAQDRQDRRVDKPQFTATALMADFSRLSKLKLSLDYAKILGIDGDAMDAVLKAETARLWDNNNSTDLTAIKQLLLNKATSANANPAVANHYPPMYNSGDSNTKKK